MSKKQPKGHRKMTGLLAKLAKVPKSEIEPKPTKRQARCKKK